MEKEEEEEDRKVLLKLLLTRAKNHMRLILKFKSVRKITVLPEDET